MTVPAGRGETVKRSCEDRRICDFCNNGEFCGLRVERVGGSGKVLSRSCHINSAESSIGAQALFQVMFAAAFQASKASIRW